MKAIRTAALCLFAVTMGITVKAQESIFPVKVSLTVTSTNSSGAFTKGKITEKSIVAACASETTNNVSDLALVFTDIDIVVANLATTNITCDVLSLDSETITNVILAIQSASKTNSAAGTGFAALIGSGSGGLPADLTGTVVFRFTEVLDESKPALKLVGTVQAGSVSNQAIYTGTISIGGKPVLVP